MTQRVLPDGNALARTLGLLWGRGLILCCVHKGHEGMCSAGGGGWANSQEWCRGNIYWQITRENPWTRVTLGAEGFSSGKQKDSGAAIHDVSGFQWQFRCVP